MRCLFVLLLLVLAPACTAGALLLVPSQYPTIQAAVDAASTGDVVIVSPGVYLVDEIHITKGITLRGTNTATCIIDGQLDPSIPFGTVYIDNPTGPVTVEGFTLRNSGLNSQGYFILLAARFISQPVTIRNCHFIGHGNGDDLDLGAYVLESSGSGTFTIQGNEFEDMWQAILLEIPRAGGKVCCNNIYDLLPGDDGITLFEPMGIFALTYTLISNGDVPNPVLIDQNTFTGFAGSCVTVGGGFPSLTSAKFTDVTISNNTIDAIGTGLERRHLGVALINYAATLVDAPNGGVYNTKIVGNDILGAGGSDSHGVLIWGKCDNTTVSGNNIKNTWRGIAVEEKNVGAGFASGVVAHFSNITGNTTGCFNASTNLINAENNWWGAASGPGGVGPGTGDPVTANVDFTPWLTEPSALIDVLIEPEGLAKGLMIRDITFTLTTSPPVVVTSIVQPVSFCSGIGYTRLYGIADSLDEVCISAKDRQHSLVQKLALVDVGGRSYKPMFTGADKLLGGDINNDNVVDIYDYGILAAQFGTTGHPFAFPLLDADLNCTGIVDKADGGILYSHYLQIGDLRCDQNYNNTPVPVTHILCSQLAPLVGGLTNARKGDMNNDYQLTQADVNLFRTRKGIP